MTIITVSLIIVGFLTVIIISFKSFNHNLLLAIIVFTGVPEPGGLPGQVREAARHPVLHEERQVASDLPRLLF